MNAPGSLGHQVFGHCDRVIMCSPDSVVHMCIMGFMCIDLLSGLIFVTGQINDTVCFGLYVRNVNLFVCQKCTVHNDPMRIFPCIERRCCQVYAIVRGWLVGSDIHCFRCRESIVSEVYFSLAYAYDAGQY